MKFTLYGQAWRSISYAALLDEQKQDRMLWAHAENPGSEGCYVEVAKWCNERRKWFRYCFLKTMDVHRCEIGLPDDATDKEVALFLADQINKAGGAELTKIIGGFDDYCEVPLTTPSDADFC